MILYIVCTYFDLGISLGVFSLPYKNNIIIFFGKLILKQVNRCQQLLYVFSMHIFIIDFETYTN